MTDNKHKFRYLLPPGTRFRFVSKFKAWVIVSLLLMAATVGLLFVNKAARGEYLNWTIDFKGGTEMKLAFTDATGSYTRVEPGAVREALRAAGEEGCDVSTISWGVGDTTFGRSRGIDGIIVRTPRFSALPDDVKHKAAAELLAGYEQRWQLARNPSWSGDRIKLVSKAPIPWTDVKGFFDTYELEIKKWTADEAESYARTDESSRLYSQWYGVRGIDKQFEKILRASLSADGSVEPVTFESYAVGAKAGDKLRDDAARAIVYALFLIMLYLAFRFDVRYAPGAAFATIHDAFMVIGVFAITWTEVSLVSVAGLLTVMGYSVNDTVIIFDRIRENQARLAGHSLERIVDISLNETLVRTILTSSTVFATTLIMNIFAGGHVANFAFTMNIGVLVGTYSSIFLAAPVFLWISKRWYGPGVKRRVLARA